MKIVEEWIKLIVYYYYRFWTFPFTIKDDGIEEVIEWNYYLHLEFGKLFKYEDGRKRRGVKRKAQKVHQGN